MPTGETYQYDLTKKLSFVRYGGTAEEARAAQILMDEIAALGGEAELMPFEVPAYRINACSMKVTDPFEKEIPCVPYGLSGEIAEDAQELALCYIEVNAPAAFCGHEDLSGCAVMVNSPLDFDMYYELVKRKASAVIVINNDKWYQTEDDVDLPPRNVRPTMLAAGKIPTFAIRSREAADIQRAGAKRVKITLRQTEEQHESRNVLATVRGTGQTNECVVVTAHYDSVWVGTGSWDNATGAATIMYLYRHFLHNPPKRTMRFIWCGSEEQGLLGSRAYVAQHEKLLPDVRMCFNFDMCGTLLGSNRIFLTGTDELKTVCEMICNEAGYPAVMQTTVHSSDSAPFADRGIPGVGLSRGSSSGEIHTRHDLMNPLSAEKLKMNGDFAIHLISRFVNAAVFPVKREMSEQMTKDLEKYFGRDKLARLEKDGNTKA